ncbi:glutathione S-transferase family protein [Pseudomonas segetis]|uniref:Glutathione S-transferase n=1 Tax=Pseudomonas segetis TaxID=298908 RepID=A0A239CWD4_9PSED|nr:glutathione S-transferase family protein [Pseudomonas segetis]SNS24162.1 glutathione S-transferase [Pseudomonas segetis]
MTLQLVIGDKRYSSWSLRAALALEIAGVDYDEVLIALNKPDTAQLIAQHSPSGKVPLLKTADGPVWDSLAIVEYLAEQCPSLWPKDVYARAVARSVCAQMHSGFASLRTHMPMDLQRAQPLANVAADVTGDIEQVCRLWAECRAGFGQQGPFLFGQPSAADAFYAPVASRLRSYQVELPPEASAYVEAIYNWPAFQRWYKAAQEEQLG